MSEKPTFNPEDHKETPKQVETTQVNGKIYEIDKLRAYAETLPILEIPLNDLREAVGEGHVYWIDRQGEQLAPYQIIQNWEAAQQNNAWADHVASINRADLNNPIWATEQGHVFDGVHRLTRAVIDNVPTIKVQVFKELPDSALAQM